MSKAVVKIDESRCKGCYMCVGFCPRNILSRGSEELNRLGYYSVRISENADECIGCQSCALMCPDGAISIYRS